VAPSVVQVYMEGHKGSYPTHPEILCDAGATERLVSTNAYYLTIFSPSNLFNSMCCRIAMLMRCRKGTGLMWIGGVGSSMRRRRTLLVEVHLMGGMFKYCNAKIMFIDN
jgi:hypothetical protein